MMVRFALFGLAMIATEASALSCLRPDAVRSFNNAANATEVYHVYLGELTLAAPLEKGATALAQFTGQGLLKDGFAPIGKRTFSVVSACAAEWCGGLGTQANALLFARVAGGNTVVDVSPCGNWVFENPTQETIQAVEACMRGEPCEEGPLFR